MPLYKTITVDSSTKIFIWKVEESYEELAAKTTLTPYCLQRLSALKKEEQRKQFLSVRLLLKEIGYTGNELFYNNNGKPYLQNKNHVSVTHSHHFAGIIISASPVGIDLEKQRSKILKIAPKFTPPECYKNITDNRVLCRKLTAVWGAKEAIYKIMNTPGLSFLKHINVHPFSIEDKSISAEVHYKNTFFKFTVKFLEFENFTCVYALSSKLVLEP